MTEDNPPEDDSRRNFLKGTAAAGITATGLAAFSGNAAAQNVRNLQIGDVTIENGILNISLRNVNILRGINIEDVVVTVIGGDVRILEGGINTDITINDSLIELKNIDVDVLNDALNQNDVQVAVAVLGTAGNVLAAGDTIA